MRATIKALRLISHLVTGVLLCAAVALDFGKRLVPEKLARWWSQRLLHILNIHVNVHGRGVNGARVIVANHISWLDIPVICSMEETRFVAKSEVRHWPIAGWFAVAAGTLFIRRGKGGSKPLLAAAVPHLKAGGSFVFFPEGTTTAGASVLKFHPRLFSAAIEAQCRVQPLALRYEPSPSGAAVAPFIGDDDLVSHILRVLREKSLTVEMTYLQSIDAAGRERDGIAASAHAAIREVVASAAEPTFADVHDEDEAIDATLTPAFY